MKLLAVQLKLQ